MNKGKVKPESHLPSKHRLRKQIIAALISVGALVLLVIVGFKLVADRAAGDYTAAATKQKAEIAGSLKKLAEISRQQQGETADAAKLREAIAELDKSVAAYVPPRLTSVPLGVQLSQAYQQANRDTNDYLKDVDRLKTACARLVAFSGYHAALQKVLGNSGLFTSVTDEKAALAREKSWRDAAAQLDAFTTDETVLKAATNLLGKGAEGVADVLKATAAHFKAHDVSKIEQDQVTLEKKIAAMRADVGVLVAFRHELQQQLTSAVARLD